MTELLGRGKSPRPSLGPYGLRILVMLEDIDWGNLDATHPVLTPR